MDSRGTRNPPPAYDPHLVARGIAHACETPVRDLTIGGAGGVSMVIGNLLAPRVMDWVAARLGHASMTTRNPGDPAERDNLYEPREDLSENSSLRPLTRKTSLALEAQLKPGCDDGGGGWRGGIDDGATATGVDARKSSFLKKRRPFFPLGELTMKALCWHGKGDIRCDSVADPSIEDARDVILKVSSCAICGSDLHLMDGQMPTMESGDVLGHEFMGEVVEVGSPNHKLKKGDRVVVPFNINCGECRQCKLGNWSCCLNSNRNAAMACQDVRVSDSGLVWLLASDRRVLGWPGGVCARADGGCGADGGAGGHG